MSEATSKTCEECGGRGFRGVKGGLCPTCNGTGIVTTGKILGTLPSTPDPVTDEPHEPTITTTQGDAPSVVTGNGLRYVYAPGHDSGATVTDERDATIAEQSAEIERLKGELHEAVARTRAECDKGYAALFGAHQQMVADRDTLRLEVQKLKDLSFEAQDRYAALEAERDELRTRTDHHTQTLVMLGEERERLIRHRKDERERAEKYLAVINAQADMIDAQERHAAVSLRLSVAYAAAGFVAEARVTADVPMMAKEADHE